MISFALFGATLIFPGGSPREISVCDLSADGFTFRLAKDDDFSGETPSEVRCHTNGFREHGDFTVYRFTVEPIGADRYSRTFRLISDDPAFIGHMKNLMKDFTEYSLLKNENPDAELTLRYTGCPLPADPPPDFAAWRYNILSSLQPDDGQWLSAVSQVKELVWHPSGIRLLRRIAETKVSAAWQEALAEAGLGQHPLCRLVPRAVCLGSSFCPDLFPDLSLLKELLRVCGEERVNVLFAFPPIPENRLSWFEDMIRALDQLFPGEPIEILLNDPGACSVARRLIPDRIRLLAGPLMVRRRKDPRIAWWRGDPKNLDQTSANSPACRQWLASFGIRQVLWEACGYPIRTMKDDLLQLPFYQVSTGTFCPLRAAVLTGKRGKQAGHDACHHECEDFSFLYGEEIGLTGRFNSLFGADTRSLEDGAYLSSLLRPGITRLVIDLL